MKVFKAEYLSNGDCLDAPLGYNPNTSQALVKEGMGWRLGNGHSINIWKQPWLQKQDKCYVSSSPPLGLEHMTINSLIRVDQNSWILDNAQQIINNDDLQDIQMMPLINTHEKDLPIWKASATEI